ncbi:SGNH/GDSL hydrolase family protein [Nonomuraea sp. NPDC005692]|uniref:SGNH/GDSL hydrolase family protein n=1 Tax=Nonomuraea sp. NPDC005692 TaxID=3157168 RepID=UPI003406C658
MSTVWLFTGDSVTQGALHTFGWRDYTQLFAERVRFELNRPSDVVINTGVSGQKVSQLDVENAVLRHRPDVVVLMFGLNDCVAGPAGLPAFGRDYAAVVSRVREAGAKVVLQTPNRAPESGWADLSAYAEVVRSLDADVLVDHHAAWDGGEHWMGSGCHPNEYGHRALARNLLRALDLWEPVGVSGSLFIP